MPESAERSVPMLSRLKPPVGAVRNKKRKGRGVGSLGKTAGKGMKGQKARHPNDFGKVGFEGGQMPLQRRLPKFGFHNPFSKRIEVVNLRDLHRFEAGSTVDIAALLERGLIRRRHDGVKVLGTGDVDRPLKLRVHAVSAAARNKIEAAGGSVELIAVGTRTAPADQAESRKA